MGAAGWRTDAKRNQGAERGNEHQRGAKRFNPALLLIPSNPGELKLGLFNRSQTPKNSTVSLTSALMRAIFTFLLDVTFLGTYVLLAYSYAGGWWPYWFLGCIAYLIWTWIDGIRVGYKDPKLWEALFS